MSKSNGRICLAGEDLDWTGGKSVLYPINLYTSIYIKSLSHSINKIIINSSIASSIKIIDVDKLQSYTYSGDFYDYIIAGIKVFQKYYKCITSMDISIISSLPVKSGLSSSAALLTALFNELAKFYKIKLTINEICELSYITEALELKSNVGKMDFYVCGLNNTLCYDGKNDSFSLENLTFKDDIYFVLINSGISSSTKSVNALKHKRFQNKEENFMKYLETGNNLVSALITELRTSKNLNKIGKIITSYHYIMDKYLQVSTPKINECVNLCLSCGALGAKLTGCGLGGYVFCIIHKQKINLLTATLQKNNYKYIIPEHTYYNIENYI